MCQMACYKTVKRSHGKAIGAVGSPGWGVVEVVCLSLALVRLTVTLLEHDCARSIKRVGCGGRPPGGVRFVRGAAATTPAHDVQTARAIDLTL